MISVLLLAILISYAPWDQVIDILSDFEFGTIVILVALSLAYYGLKALRFWLLLKAMGITKSRKLVTLSYMSAQPVSLLPAGEIYRSHALERYTGVPVKDSLAQFTMQGLLEAAGMCVIAVVSALALHTLRVPFLVLTALVLIGAIAIRKGHIASVTRLLNKLPFVNITESTIQDFSKRHRAVLTRRWLPRLLLISLLIEIVGAVIAYVSVAGIGQHINVYQAALLYVIPVITGFLSLLPGGFGVSEHSAVGVLLLSNVSIGDAVAATLIMRVTIVGLGVFYGFLAGLAGRYILRNNKA